MLQDVTALIHKLMTDESANMHTNDVHSPRLQINSASFLTFILLSFVVLFTNLQCFKVVSSDKETVKMLSSFLNEHLGDFHSLYLGGTHRIQHYYTILNKLKFLTHRVAIGLL